MGVCPYPCSDGTAVTGRICDHSGAPAAGGALKDRLRVASPARI